MKQDLHSRLVAWLEMNEDTAHPDEQLIRDAADAMQLAGDAMIEWQPIAGIPDSLKDGREVLLWDSGHGAVIGSRVEYAPGTSPDDQSGVWAEVNDCIHLNDVTHYCEINGPAVTCFDCGTTYDRSEPECPGCHWRTSVVIEREGEAG